MRFDEWNESLKGMLAICGKQGSGKTLLATMLAYADYLRGRTVYSNYPLSFDHVPITSTEVLKEAKDGTVLLDEAYQLADSRRSSSKKNVLISTILAKARKHGLRYIIIQQYWRTIDLRLRHHADWILFPSIYEIDERKMRPSVLRVQVFTRDDTGYPVLDDVVYVPVPETAFKLYDTTADVYPFEEKPKAKKITDYTGG